LLALIADFLIAAVLVLGSITTPYAAGDLPTEPNQETIREFAAEYMQNGMRQKMTDRDLANQLASQLFWLEKLQTICPSYYYVNMGNARFGYLMRQGAWSMLFGPGKTSTEIMNKASARRNEEFNNSVSKKAWCENVKAFVIKTFGWNDLFEKD
jgi:hypothetical protein